MSPRTWVSPRNMVIPHSNKGHFFVEALSPQFLEDFNLLQGQGHFMLCCQLPIPKDGTPKAIHLWLSCTSNFLLVDGFFFIREVQAQK